MKLLSACFVAMILTASVGADDRTASEMDCGSISRQCNAFCTFKPDPSRCYDDCMRFDGC